MKRVQLALILLLAFFIPLTASYYVKTVNPTETKEQIEEESAQASYDYNNAVTVLSKATGRNIFKQFLMTLTVEEVDSMVQQAKAGTKPISVNGETLNVLYSRYSEEIDGKNVIDLGSNGKEYFDLGFAGDINFDEDGNIMTHAAELANGITDCIDEEFRQAMSDADVMLLNNEFTYSEQGLPMANKQFTFRANPASVKYLSLLNVDIVSLANNHVYDYGEDAFLDTIKTLDNQGIPHVGAGSNSDEAERTVSYIINGCKVAYLAASRAENYRLTPVAGKETPGVFGCYDESEELIEAIKTAKTKNDYVVVYVHWGTEYSTTLQDSQISLAKKYIDAGADAVIGAHPHILQGMDFYNGKPICYSLGNFLFNSKTLDSGMAVVRIPNASADGNITLKFIPGRQEDCELHYLDNTEQRKALFERIVNMSPSEISIDKNGNVTKE